MYEKKGADPMKFYTDSKHEKLDATSKSNVIQNVISNGPAGLMHVSVLSKILKRCIRVWMKNLAICTFGRADDKPEIDLEFKTSESSRHLGHWTLRGGKNPSFDAGGLNNCLYDCVASQTGLQSSELRRRTAAELCRARSFNSLANSMLGGARYYGRSSTDAKVVLDASQQGSCHPEGRSGHPRGHASHPAATGSTDSIENYSYSRWRSGFLSRDEQDLVCHYTLITSSARDLMERLNHGEFKADAHIGRNQVDYDPLPKAQIWREGQPEGSPGDFQRVCLVGKHFLNMHKDSDANIFVLTFYPIL